MSSFVTAIARRSRLLDNDAIGPQLHALDRRVIRIRVEGRRVQLGWEGVDDLPADHSIALLIAEPDIDILLRNLIDLDRGDPLIEGRDALGTDDPFFQGDIGRRRLGWHVYDAWAGGFPVGVTLFVGRRLKTDPQPRHLREGDRDPTDLDLVVVDGERVGVLDIRSRDGHRLSPYATERASRVWRSSAGSAALCLL